MAEQTSAKVAASAWLTAALWVVLYGSVSILTTISTKAVVSGFKFKELTFMMLLERLLVMASLGLSGNLPAKPLTAMSQLWALALVSLLNTFVALSSLEGLNVPMYNALKRLTSLVTLLAEFLILNKRASREVSMAVLLIAAGAVLAGLHDLEYAPLSYLWAMGSCCLNALYLTLMKKFQDAHPEHSSDLLFVNSAVTVPVLACGLFASGHLQEVLYSGRLVREWDLVGMLTLSTFLGSSLGYTQYRCTKSTSALTTTVVGQMKMALSSALGVAIFGTKMEFWQECGLLVNTIGGFYFAYRKHFEAQSRTQQMVRQRKSQ